MAISKRVRHATFYLLARTLITLSQRLPRRLVLTLFGLLGYLIYLSAGGLRRRVLSNLEIAYGEQVPFRERKKLARRSFVEVARNAAEAEWRRFFRPAREERG